MKKITTILFLLIGYVSFSQSNLTIFNNGGQQFYVILNGVKQNSVPMTNVTVSGIKNGSYSTKVIFSDGKTADIDKNFFIEEPSDITTRVIFKKGKGKLQLIGMEPTKGSIQQEGVLVYRPDNSAVYSDAVVEQAVITQETITTTTTTTNSNGTNGDVQINQSGNVQSGSTQTETINVSVGSSTNGQSVNQTVNVSDPNNSSETVGMNVNINVSETGGGTGNESVNMSINMSGTGVGTQTNQTTQENTQFSQTTTITTTGTQTNSATNSTANNINSSTNTTTTQSTPVVNCKNILGDGDTFVEDVNSLTMDEDKKELILKDLSNYCLTASQAYKITEVLTFEEDRLTVAKFLYDRMIDKDNGRTLMDLFTFDSSKMEYREYIRK